MLKITEISPDILQVSMGYIKTFLGVTTIVFLAFMIFLVFSYEYISIEANRSENFCKIHYFSFFSGFKKQVLELSSIQEMRSNISRSRASRYVNTYEHPALFTKNAESVFLLKRRRAVAYVSKISQKFNHFLKLSSENDFTHKTIYLGVFGSIILSVLGGTLIVMLITTILVGDVRMTFNKKENTYKINYLSPVYQNKKGDLNEIKNVLIISEIQKSFSEKQGGLYLEFQNGKLILIQPLGVTQQEQVPPKLRTLRKNAEKIANFLKIGVKTPN